MVASSPCPDAQVLQRLLLGQLPTAQVEPLGEHLLRCDRCAETMHSLQTEDQLVQALHAGFARAPEPEIDRIEALIQHLKEQPPFLDSGQTEAAVTPPPAAQQREQATPTPIMPLAAAASMPATEAWYGFLAPAQEPGEIGRLGPYRVLKVLGEGGMGVVFQAEDPRLKRSVALKVMKPALAESATARQRFLREAQATAAIEHDHVIVIHQADEDRGVPFLAMPLLKGETLEDRLRREQLLSIADVLRIGREIAEGLAAAHENKLIHRDVKPSNIWLEGKRGRVKILDFGLARATEGDPRLSSYGTIAGTPQYMAPEQAGGGTVDGRCDLFALGCVLYRMCTGQLPFQGVSAMQVLRSLEMEQPKAPRQLNPEVPPGLSDLVLRLLAKDPAGRPPSALAVVELLATLEEKDQPPRPRDKGPNGGRRLRIAACLLGALAVCILFGPALIRIATNKGELVIETEGQDVEVSVKQQGVTLYDRAKGRKFELTAGDGEVEVFEAGGGVHLFTKKFTIERGGKQVVSVRLEMAKAEKAPGLEAGPKVNVSPLDRLEPALIPPEERFDWQPKELVAVLGIHRGKHWGFAAPPSVAVSPDGKLLASGGADNVIRLWDAATLEERAVLRGHTGSVDGVAFAPDGQRLASGSGDGTIRIWDLSGLRPKEQAVLIGDEKRMGVSSVAFSPDGKTLASGDYLGNLFLWDLTRAHPNVRVALRSHRELESGVRSVTFSPNGKLLASAGGLDPTVFLWDLREAEPKPIAKLLKDKGRDNSNPPSLAFAQDGKTLIVGNLGDHLRFLDLGGPAPKERPTGGEMTGYVVATSPDGKRLAIVNRGIFQLWDMEPPVPVKTGWMSTGSSILFLAFAPDGNTVFTTGYLTGVKAYDVTGGTPKERGLQAPWLWVIAVTPDGQTIVTDNAKGERQLWNLSGTKPEELGKWPDAKFYGSVASFSADGKTLAIPHINGSVLVWKVKDRKLQDPVQLVMPPSSVGAVAVAPDGRRLATTNGGDVWIWDLTGPEPKKQQVCKGAASSLHPPCLAFSPDGGALACGFLDRVALLTWAEGEFEERTLLEDDTRSVSFAADCRKLACGCGDGRIRVWDLTGADPNLNVVLKGHSALNSAAFSPDGKAVLSGDEDGHLVLWEVASRKKLRQLQLPGHVEGVYFPADGRHVITSNGNGTVYVLRLAPAPAGTSE